MLKLSGVYMSGKAYELLRDAGETGEITDNHINFDDHDIVVRALTPEECRPRGVVKDCTFINEASDGCH